MILYFSKEGLALDKKMLFLFNPHSGKAQIKNKLCDLVDVFTKGGYDVLVHPTQYGGDARDISKEYAEKRRALIGKEAMDPMAGDPYCGDTVYLCAADGEGNMISYIQSTFAGFGSGISLPGTGIVFQKMCIRDRITPRAA